MSVSRWSIKNKKTQDLFPDSGQWADDLELAQYLQLKARAQRKMGTRGIPGNVSKVKRKIRDYRSSFLKRMRRASGHQRKVLKRIDALLYRPKPSLIRDTLVPKFCTNWTPITRRLYQRGSHIHDLQNFSFAKDPNGVLHKLRDLAKASLKYAEIKINFLDSDCDDVTPYIVLSHLRRSLPPVFNGGYITSEVGTVVEAVGLKRDLKIGSISKIPDDSSISAFPLYNRAPPGAFGDDDRFLRPQLKEIIADRFCDTMNDWLKGQELDIDKVAEGLFAGAIGEALDNAERHGNLDYQQSEGDWSIAAFSRLDRVDGHPVLRCSVGIVSVGATISESLASAAPEVTKLIDAYVRWHSPALGAKFTAENLRTVMALQDGITRVGQATAGRRGGVGLMELIEIFSNLGSTERADHQSMFTIVSGSTCIRVTGAYRCGRQVQGGLRELWFNERNAPEDAPSETHVHSLDSSFPGVILSACFTIDPDHIKQKLADHGSSIEQD